MTQLLPLPRVLGLEEGGTKGIMHAPRCDYSHQPRRLGTDSGPLPRDLQHRPWSCASDLCDPEREVRTVSAESDSVQLTLLGQVRRVRPG
jgi:hypothetical protein